VDHHQNSFQHIRRAILVNAMRGAAGATAGTLPLWAVAQGTYPRRTVRIINPFPPGSPFDVVARLAAERLQKALGQAFVVENRTGAGGTLGTAEVTRAPGDGYTMLVQATSMLTTTSLLYKSLSYDINKDLVPIWSLQSMGFVMVVNPKLSVKTVREFIAYAKANPGKVTVGSAGNGTIHHLSAEVFMANTGTQLLHVPYRGAVPAEVDLMAGHIDCIFDSLNGVLSSIQGGKMRAIAVLRSDRAKAIPDVPTMREAGVPGMEPPLSSIGLFAPAGLSADIRARIIATLNESIKTPESQVQLDQLGFEKVVAGDDVTRQLQREKEFYEPLIKAADIKLD
jgi:tripartite-type tricarboxylate transporter receptor subunit TctC